MSATDHFQSVTMMIEDLRSDDPEARLTSMRGLHCIAQTLGPDRVRGELIPYVMDYLDEDDEVLKTLATSLGTMLAEVGGPAHADTLLVALETLCTLDEVSVREEAIGSLGLIANTIFSSDTLSTPQQQYMSLLGRLTKNPEPRARSSAARLIAAPYNSATAAVKKELRAKFTALCSDEEVMVRRAACVSLAKDIATTFGSNCNELMGSFASMCRDSSDSIRLQAVPAAIALLPHLKDTNISQVISMMKTLYADNSWRVRYMFADKFGEFCKALPSRDVSKVAASMFRALCQDTEPEIRSSAIYHLDTLLAAISDSESSVKRDVLQCAPTLANDESPHVRSTMATVLLKSTAHAPGDLCQSILVPTALKQLEDSDADVRLALLASFGSIGSGAKGDDVAKLIAPKLLPIVVSSLNKDPKWRVRETVVRQAPLIIPYLGDDALQLVSVCLEGLSDRVATIRAAAAEGCAKLLQLNGVAWGKKELMPQLVKMGRKNSFLPRLTFLQVLQKLIDVVPPQTVREDYLPLLTELSVDPVSNVRVNVVKTLQLIKNKGILPSSEVDALAVRFTVDKDRDVKELAAALR